MRALTIGSTSSIGIANPRPIDPASPLLASIPEPARSLLPAPKGEPGGVLVMVACCAGPALIAGGVLAGLGIGVVPVLSVGLVVVPLVHVVRVVPLVHVVRGPRLLQLPGRVLDARTVTASRRGPGADSHGGHEEQSQQDRDALRTSGTTHVTSPVVIRGRPSGGTDDARCGP